MGTKSIALILIITVVLSSASYGWENLRTGNAAADSTTPHSVGKQWTSSPNQLSPTPFSGPGQAGVPNYDTMANDASGWPVYPYPSYHNPYYSENSPRDLFSGTVDWIVGFPSTVMDSLSNFLDRKVFPQMPATHGARSANPNTVQPLYVKPEKPAGLPPATPYVSDEGRAR